MSKSRDLREACIAEALAIVATEGPEKLSLRDVARRLGVSHQAPYRHFASRDHIFAEIVARAYRAFAIDLGNSMTGKTPREDLAAMGLAYLAYARREPLAYRLMFATPLPDAESHPEMMKEARFAFDMLRSVLRRLREEQSSSQPKSQARKTNVPDVTRDALFIWSAMHGFASIQLSSVRDTLDISDRIMADMVHHLLFRIEHGLLEEIPPIPIKRA